MVQVHLLPPLRSPGLKNSVRGSLFAGFDTFLLAQTRPLSLPL